MLIQNKYIKVIDFGTAKHFDEEDTTFVDYGLHFAAFQRLII